MPAFISLSFSYFLQTPTKLFSVAFYSTLKTPISLLPSFETTPIARFLLNECGFSLHDASAICARKPGLLCHESYDNSRQTLLFLRDKGFHEIGIRKIFSKEPSILRSSFQDSVKPKVEFLEKIGLTGQKLSRALERDPHILSSSIIHVLEPNVSFLQSVLSSPESDKTTGKPVSNHSLTAYVISLNPRILQSTKEILVGLAKDVEEMGIENGATFRLDYGLVYWNSRLEHEHKRLVSHFQPGQIVCDMFSGVGPFAIPAAQRGCFVFANDLNPASVNYLRTNAELNKVKGKIFVYNMDARDFMHHLMVKTVNEPDLGGQFEEHRTSNLELLKSTVELKNGNGSLPGENVSENTETPGGDTIVKSGKWLKGSMEGGEIAESCYIRSSSCDQNIVLDLAKIESSKKNKRKEKEGTAITCIEISKSKPWEHFDHVIMNLPASALEFLDVFQGLFSRSYWKGPMPWIHCYCFMRSNETEEMIIERAETALLSKIEDPIIHRVRDVAPNKAMLCFSFRLPETAAFKDDNISTYFECQDDQVRNISSEALLKRPRTDTGLVSTSNPV